MPTRPLVELVALQMRVPRGHAGFWQIICDLGGGGAPFGLADIDGRSNVDRRNISDYVGRLVRAGYLVISDREPTRTGHRAVYRLVKTAREAPRLRRDGTEYPEPARDRMWRAMKMLGTWTAAELAAATETETLPPVGLVTVKTYVARLVAADVVHIVSRSGPTEAAQYRVLRNIGASAPRILRTHAVFDPNTNTVIGVAEAEEV